MKSGKLMPLSLAVTCLAFLAPQLAHAQSMNTQGTVNSGTGYTINPAAQQRASQMVPAAVHLVKTLDAKKTQPGTQFEVVVDGTVHLKDGTELPHGTVLLGTVATDQMQISGTSRLALRFTEAKLKDGRTFPIQAMIAGVGRPDENMGDQAGGQAPLAWNSDMLQVDELGALHNVDLHSRIAGSNSGVFVSTKNDDMKLSAGSRLSLAIAAENNGQPNPASGGM